MNLATLTNEDEDRITKVELAHEIERTRNQFHSCDNEVYAAIDKLKEFVNQKMTELNEQNKSQFADEEARLRSLFNGAEKELEAKNLTLLNRFQEKISDLNSSVDARMQELQEIVERKAEKEVERYLGDIHANVRETAKQVEIFRDEIMRATTAYQVEIRNKVSSLHAEFDSIKQKFADIAKALA